MFLQIRKQRYSIRVYLQQAIWLFKDKEVCRKERLPNDVASSRICKFGIDQWLGACDVNVNRNNGYEEREKAGDEVEQAEREIEKIIRAEEEDVECSTQDSEV